MNSQLLSPPRSLSPSCFPFSFFLLPLGDLCCYISFSSVHPPLTLVSHQCPYLSAHPIDYSFQRSVRCCGSHRTVQGSHPHQWGQGVNCRYLIQRWQLLLGLLFYHAPMAGPLGLESPLGSSRGLPRTTWRLPFLWFWSAEVKVILGNIFWQSGFPSFVFEHFFLLGVGLGLDIEWAEVSRSLWPHNSPSKSCCPAPWTGRRILTFLGLYHGRLSLVPLWVPGFLRLPKARSWHFGVRGALSLMLFWDDADRFSIQNVYSMAPLWSDADLAVEGSLGNLAKFILLDIPSLSFVHGELPQISSSI